MIGKSTIVVEDRLRENLAFLPQFLGADANLYTATFKVGDQKELLAFFAENARGSIYPLIWLDSPYEELHKNRSKVSIDGLTLILAVQTNSEMRYSERLEKTFKPVLFVMLDRILDIFTVSNTLEWDLTFKISKFGNYSDQATGEEGKFTDIWDAVKLTLDCTINNNCLRDIKI